jgi:hypothetical protein
MKEFLDRLVRAARLDPQLYEEVEADPSAIGQAAGVVVLANIAAGVGSVGQLGFNGFVVGSIAALLGWAVWAVLTYYIGTKILPEPQTRADVGELMRTLGFASAPGVIRFLGVIPGFGAPTAFVAAIWMLVAMVVAVRQALDYQSTGRAIGVCLIGFVVQSILIFAFMRPMLVQ